MQSKWQKAIRLSIQGEPKIGRNERSAQAHHKNDRSPKNRSPSPHWGQLQAVRADAGVCGGHHAPRRSSGMPTSRRRSVCRQCRCGCLRWPSRPAPEPWNADESSAIRVPPLSNAPGQWEQSISRQNPEWWRIGLDADLPRGSNARRQTVGVVDVTEPAGQTAIDMMTAKALLAQQMLNAHLGAIP
jgi:hypothetical protein